MGLSTALATRVINLHYEPADVYIGRGSPFGNPYTHLVLGRTKALYKCSTRWESIVAYENWIFQQPAVLALIGSLQGKKLGCYCVPLPCHGVILVRLVITYAEMRDAGILPDWNTLAGIAVIRRHYDTVKGRVPSHEAYSSPRLR